MNYQNLFTCQDVAHEGQEIQGFCLNINCKESRSQFCLLCAADLKKHITCKKDLKPFGQISTYITQFDEVLLNLSNRLNNCYTQVSNNYQEFSKQSETLKTQLGNTLNNLKNEDYQQIKDDMFFIRELYQYLFHPDEVTKQNKTGSLLRNVEKMVNAMNLDQGYQQENLEFQQKGILLLNKQNWKEANESFSKQIQILEKKISFSLFFQCIALLEMNQPGKAIQLREKAKKLNNSLFRDLLELSDQELYKNPKNTAMLITKSYALNDDKKYEKAILECEKILKENPNHLHALYRKSASLSAWNHQTQSIAWIDKVLLISKNYSLGHFQKGCSLNLQGNYQDAIYSFDKAIQIDPNYINAYIYRGETLNNLKKYNEAIACYDKAIELDPNCIIAYINKGAMLDEIKKYSDAINCYNKAIELDPNCAQAYNNKGGSLEYKGKYEDALKQYDLAIQIDPTLVNAYKNKGSLLTQKKKYQLAIETYEQAIKLCKQEENQFYDLIALLKNKK